MKSKNIGTDYQRTKKSQFESVILKRAMTVDLNQPYRVQKDLDRVTLFRYKPSKC